MRSAFVLDRLNRLLPGGLPLQIYLAAPKPGRKRHLAIDLASAAPHFLIEMTPETDGEFLRRKWLVGG